MGVWGTTLYANDTACDVRDDYIEKLKRGKSNTEATEELIEKNKDILGDVEEEPLFWFALADTQWDYGRLIDNVKEKAMFFLSQKIEFERWEQSNPKHLEQWKKTLLNLKEKLERPQPTSKKVSKYRIYQCKWNLGDVFAYRFESELSKKYNFYGKYIVFRKISEARWYPEHIIPVVQVYKWIGNDIPSLDFIQKQKLLQQGSFSSVLKYKPNWKREYFIKLLSISERVIPNKQLYFIGNIPGEDLIPYNNEVNDLSYVSTTAVCWEGQKFNNKFEKYIIEMYLSWKGID